MPLRRGQQHHAVGVDDLVVERLHHRRGVLEQEAVFVQRVAQVAAARAGEVGLVDRVDAERRERWCDCPISSATGAGLSARGGSRGARLELVYRGGTHVVSRVRGQACPVIHRPRCVVRWTGRVVWTRCVVVFVSSCDFLHICVTGINTGNPVCNRLCRMVSDSLVASKPAIAVALLVRHGQVVHATPAGTATVCRGAQICCALDRQSGYSVGSCIGAGYGAMACFLQTGPVTPFFDPETTP